jgi:hypothetical protein
MTSVTQVSLKLRLLHPLPRLAALSFAIKKDEGAASMECTTMMECVFGGDRSLR